MIIKNSFSIKDIRHHSIKFSSAYKGKRLLWVAIREAIRSCFGSGSWISNKPWIDDDIWKNN